MDVAIVAVISSATVGAIGVLVPAMTRRRDRAHEVQLEKLRGRVSRTEWARDHQAEAYSVLQRAVHDHRLRDQPPEPKVTLKASTDGSGNLRRSSDPRSVEAVVEWSHERTQILETASAEAEVWMSARVARAWGLMAVAAAAYDGAHLVASYAKYEGAPSSAEVDVPDEGELAHARHEVILRIALDLQGAEYWAGIDPSDVMATPAT